MNLYSHPEWVRFREEVIKLDGGRCVRCYLSRDDGVVLQVHHKGYAPGRKPWEYGHTECETLCKGCHAAEHGFIPPKSGWVLIGSDDLGDLCGNCEYCGTQLRYTYAVIHPAWGAMAVGTDCCDNLTGTTLASEHHEKYIKMLERRKRFVSSKRWKRSARGGCWIVQENLRVFIVPRGDKYRITMDNVEGKVDYFSLVDAKMKVFDFIETGEARAFFAKRGARERRHRQWMRNELRSNPDADWLTMVLDARARS